MTDKNVTLSKDEMVFSLSGGIERAAVISPCGKYRYSLWRKWAESERMPVMWMMLNPSTADANIDDPTIKRCMEFSRRWGYGAMWVGNLYAYRTPYPSELWNVPAEDRIGPWNAHHCHRMGAQSAKVICAWGANGQSYHAIRQIGCPGGYWHLGRTASGQPKHPLARGKHFIPYNQPLAKYRV